MFKKPKRKVHHVFIHCSASDRPEHDNIETIRQWHLARGFSDVGYHYFIRKDGTLEKGRPLEKTPAAQKGHNRHTIAICLHGLKIEKFTDAQKETLLKLCKTIDAAYDNISFHGHCEVSAKACPVIDYKTLLNLDAYGSLNGNADTLANITQKTPEALPQLQLGSRGEAVAYLQQMLFIRTDGIFGPQTSRAVKAFKKAHNLYPSDIVKSYVWRLLMENERVKG